MSASTSSRHSSSSSRLLSHLEYIDCFAPVPVIRALPLQCAIPLARQPHLVKGVRLKAALVGQVVDGQAAAGIGVHTVWPA
jgi:hypothetical protein